MPQTPRAEGMLQLTVSISDTAIMNNPNRYTRLKDTKKQKCHVKKRYQ